MNESSSSPNGEPDHDDKPSNETAPEIAEFAELLKTTDSPIAKLARPLPEEALARIEARVLESSANPPTQARVIPLRSRFRWAWGLVAAAAALSVMFGALLWMRPRPKAVAYHLEVKGDSAIRGDKPRSDDPVHLGPSTPLVITLTPKEPARDMALRVLIVRGNKAQILAPAQAIGADGSIAIRGPAREILGDQSNGPAELVIMIGRSLPDDEAVEDIARDSSREAPDGVTVLRRAMLLEEWGSTLRSIKPNEVEFAGCNAVVAGPKCEISNATTLRFWVPSLEKGLSVHLDGRAGEAKTNAVLGGTRLSVVIDKKAHEAVLVGPSGETIFRLPLQTSLDVPALDEARREMKKNNLKEAEAKVEAAINDSRPEVKLQALRIQGRIELRRRGGKTKELLSRAADEDRIAGRISDEMDDRYLLAYQQMIVDYDFAAAKNNLAMGAELEEQCSERRVDGDYYRGLLAVEMGRLDEAIRWLRRSSQRAERLDLPEHDRAARITLADVLGIMGRHEEARALHERALEDAATSNDPCVRARFASTAAWVQMRAIETRDDYNAAFDKATKAAKLAKRECPSALGLSLLNVAFLEARARKIADARSHLEEARRVAAADDKRFQVWSDYLAMELDVVEKPAEALVTSENLRVKGISTLSPELLFTAALNQAKALDALGRAAEAKEAFVAANEAMNRWSALVPLGEGRETFFHQQENAARVWVDFLVRQAEAEVPGTLAWTNATTDAANAAETSLVRFFSALARTDFVTADDSSAYRKSREAVNAAMNTKKPAPKADFAILEKVQRATPNALSLSKTDETTRSLAPDSLTLLYHPIRDGWIGFAMEPNGQVTMARLPPLDEEALAAVEKGSRPEQLAKILLVPFSKAIRAAKHVSVPAHGRLRRVPFEALPWEGKTLSDFVTVTYGFHGASLAARNSDIAPICNGGRTALLVTNPGGDLPGARKASSLVQQALVNQGWKVEFLEQTSATREVTAAKLSDPCTGLFHYDGHAKFEGRDGLRAALVLHDGTMTVTDILALPHVPEKVALLGCATGKDEGLGLAQAFLMRGSEEVLAAMDDVDDALSQRIAERLYVKTLAGREGGLSLSGALSDALAKVREEATSKDAWWLFRVFSR